MRFRRTGLALLGSAVAALWPGAAVLASQQSEPTWTYTSRDTISAVRISKQDGVAVLAGTSLTMLDLQTGKEKWSQSGVHWISFMRETLAIVLDTAPRLIDMSTGATRWSFNEMPSLDWQYHLALHDRNQLWLHGFLFGRFTVVALALDSGRVQWVHEDWFADSAYAQLLHRLKISHHPVMLDTDTTVILFPTLGGTLRIDSRTGALLWRGETRGDWLGSEWSHARPVASEQAIFVPHGRRIMALDIATGAKTWDQTQDNYGLPSFLEATSLGLVVMGKAVASTRWPATGGQYFVDLLDLATGVSRWGQPIQRLEARTWIKVRNDTAYLVIKDDLVAVDLATGRSRQVLRIAFQGDEWPQYLESRDEGLLLSSSQNLMLVDSGRVKYQRYYAAPGPSAMGILGSILNPENSVIGARYRASAQSDAYHILFTTHKDAPERKGFAFVRIDKRTGKEAGRVWVRDRNPRYMLDAEAGVLVLFPGKSEIRVYSFEGH